MFTWRELCPLTAKEACVAFEKGLMVLGISADAGFVVKSKRDICRHAKKGGVFATDREALTQKETYYIATYTIFREDDGVIEVSKKYATKDDAKNDCHSLLAQAMREHGIRKDGKYRAVCEMHRFAFGEYRGMCDFPEEGEITLKNGVVTDVPAGFWLPF